MATWAAPEVSPAFGTVFSAIKSHADMSAAPPQPDLFTFARQDSAEQLISAAGLQMTSHELMEPAWQLSAPDELFEIFLTATVGAAMLIKSQKKETIVAIGQQITQAVADNHAVETGYRVPVPVAIVMAEKA